MPRRRSAKSLAMPSRGAWETDLKVLFAAFVEAKQAQNVLDYDDLLLWWAQMTTEPELAAEIGSLFDHVLVDEHQSPAGINPACAEA